MTRISFRLTPSSDSAIFTFFENSNTDNTFTSTLASCSSFKKIHPTAVSSIPMLKQNSLLLHLYSEQFPYKGMYSMCQPQKKNKMRYVMDYSPMISNILSGHYKNT